MTELSALIGSANKDHQWSSREIEAQTEKAGLKVGHATLNKVLNGTHGRIDQRTVLALEAVFHIHRDKITAAAGIPKIAGPYEPPRESVYLSDRQRKAITEMILSIVEGGVAHGTAAPTTPPPSDELSRRRREAQQIQRLAGMGEHGSDEIDLSDDSDDDGD